MLLASGEDDALFESDLLEFGGSIHATTSLPAKRLHKECVLSNLAVQSEEAKLREQLKFRKKVLT